MGTIVATVNIVSSTSTNAALLESKMLQYTTLSGKLHHCTFSKLKTQNLTLSVVIVCLWIHCVDQKQHSNTEVFTKSGNKTLQTSVDITNDYLQVYNKGASVKNHLFHSLHQCRCAGYTMFLSAFLLSN